MKSHMTGSGTNIFIPLVLTVIILGSINEDMCSKSGNDIRVKFLTVSSTNSNVISRISVF
jgi:hypothetical protein